MTAPLFLVDPAAYGDPRPGSMLRVAGAEGRHAVTVVRVRPGEHVLVGDGAGRRCLVRVGDAAGDVLTGEVLSAETLEPQDPSFVLVQALAKGGRDEAAVETATELGVDAVVPWSAQRCVVRWQGERGERSRRRWETTAIAATKQSRRAWVPAIEPVVAGDAAVRRVARAALALVLHEEASVPLAGVDLPGSGEVALVVGPEGGIAPAELDAFVAAGAVPVRLGREVLRTSSAGPAALAVLSARSRWLRDP